MHFLAVALLVCGCLQVSSYPQRHQIIRPQYRIPAPPAREPLYHDYDQGPQYHPYPQEVQRFTRQPHPAFEQFTPQPHPAFAQRLPHPEAHRPVHTEPQYVRVHEQYRPAVPVGEPQFVLDEVQLAPLPPSVVDEEALAIQEAKKAKKPLVDLLDPDFRLIDLTDKHMDIFLADEEAVNMLSDCFLNLDDCESSSAVNLITQIRSLGTGAKCDTCTPEEQEKLEDIVYKFILRYSTSYPLLWIRALPRLGYLLANSWMD